MPGHREFAAFNTVMKRFFESFGSRTWLPTIPIDRPSPASDAADLDCQRADGSEGRWRDHPHDADTGSPLLSVEEAASYLGIAPATLACWRTGRRGRYGPNFVKLGSRVFYRLGDLDDFIASNRVSHTGAALC